MNVLWLFDTCGFIFGPTIMLAGVAALALCARVTFRSSSRRLLRAAVGFASLPLVLGVCGFVAGFVVCMTEQVPVSWLALGKVCLAGVVVSLVPLGWALLIYRARGGTEPQLATGA